MRRWLRQCPLNWRWWVCVPVMLPGGLISLLLTANARLWQLPQRAAWDAHIAYERLCRPHTKRLLAWCFANVNAALRQEESK